MSGLQRRLEKLEETLNPLGRIIIIFVRHGHELEDSTKQQQEYFARWGRINSPIFLRITDYCDFHNEYESFIKNMRARCGAGNCYTDWWDSVHI